MSHGHSSVNAHNFANKPININAVECTLSTDCVLFTMLLACFVFLMNVQLSAAKMFKQKNSLFCSLTMKLDADFEF